MEPSRRRAVLACRVVRWPLPHPPAAVGVTSGEVVTW